MWYIAYKVFAFINLCSIFLIICSSSNGINVWKKPCSGSERERESENTTTTKVFFSITLSHTKVCCQRIILTDFGKFELGVGFCFFFFFGFRAEKLVFSVIHHHRSHLKWNKKRMEWIYSSFHRVERRRLQNMNPEYKNTSFIYIRFGFVFGQEKKIDDEKKIWTKTNKNAK